MGDQLIWQGRLTTRRRLMREAWSCAGGGSCWLLLFLVLPSLLVGGMAFAGRDPYGQVVWEFALENFRRLAGFGALGWSPAYFYILARSLWLALVVTLVSVGLAYPLAFFMAGLGPRRRALALALVAVPLCTNLIIRTYAWELLLSPQLPPARLAAWLGLIGPGEALYPGALGVYLGMVSYSLPFAVLPLYTNVERLDWSQVEAARDLYAPAWRVFVQVVLPQTLPGLSAAVVLTFVPALGIFAIADRLGGANFMLVGNAIQQQFSASRDYPFGAALSLVLILLTLAGLYLYRRHHKTMELL
jgi:spermidine/putrescine transport system permease protein